MSIASLVDRPVSKKKSQEASEPKRYGTLIRVSDDFAQKIRDAAHFERVSIADFADTFLLAILDKKYTEVMLRATKTIKKDRGE
jgi:hypothetical protein